jgi:hypothetical protein
VPNEIKATSKPVIAPAGKTLTTGATISTEELALTRPATAPKSSTENEKKLPPKMMRN